MNKFFISFAGILTSGIFAFSYLKEWVNFALLKKELVLKPSIESEYPYFHESEALYLSVTLISGLLFFTLFLFSVFFTVQKRWVWIYLCFVLTMLSIMAIMINGAIK
ncbi:hypothetical protein P872_15170 [Rhodonellum psychrophilum GCM71 = DSM 17998]|uniref:Uncharacterized protein n=2 Tax=Rhodonellum TaxID=336827 RepID=U5C3L8_9BACT|nr:hypothetical protein P872_15170 [Rhodonellum psychrophilum GCM71 = DSM 17998]SDZ42338.1 hypothetical protein SAMN05444412_1148 [Rhodonellum ikkaensis]